MNLFDETRFIMKKYNISANKKLGQNFLIDDNAVSEIVNQSEISSSDLVIEIGPGLGTLTSSLLEKAGKVIAIELDTKVLDILKDRFSLYKNFELIHNDVLKVDLKTLIENNLNSDITTCKIVANLPYYITTPIIMKLLEDNLPLKSITIMVQKEVAERLTAIPGEKNSGSITHIIYYYTEPNLILNVLRDSFLPTPEVDSAVIKLELLKTPRVQVKDKKIFFEIIKAAFSLKRKTLVNCFSNSKLFKDKEEIEEILTSLNIDLKIRGEKLTIQDFANIANLLYDKN